MLFTKTKSVGDYYVIYGRVSTASQDIKKQINLAEAVVKYKKIDKDKVIILEDVDISANKLTIEERPALKELLHLIKQGKVNTIIAYKRDRLARNFYEYVSLVKIFTEYNVDVIYTSTKEPHFTRDIVIESLYGIFAQFEGQNIVSRNGDAVKQFPPKIFGYVRYGNKKDVVYKVDANVSDDLRAFFYAVRKVKSSPELLDVLERYKSILKGKQFVDLMKYLNNPFYAARMKTQYGLEVLNHVEPIISLEVFLEVQEVLSREKLEIQSALARSRNNGLMTPVCHYCKSRMHFRTSKLGESGIYVCRKRHSANSIDIEEFNQFISNHLRYIIQHIPNTQIEKDSKIFLNSLVSQYQQRIRYYEKQLISLQKEIVNLFAEDKTIRLKSVIQEKKNINELIKVAKIELTKIEEAKEGVTVLIKELKEALSDKMKDYDLNYLANLFFESIEVSKDELIYNVRFGKYFESGDLSEYRA